MTRPTFEPVEVAVEISAPNDAETSADAVDVRSANVRTELPDAETPRPVFSSANRLRPLWRFLSLIGVAAVALAIYGLSGIPWLATVEPVLSMADLVDSAP